MGVGGKRSTVRGRSQNFKPVFLLSIHVVHLVCLDSFLFQYLCHGFLFGLAANTARQKVCNIFIL